MNKIDSGYKTVREMLDGTKHSFDYYQREYKWGTKQISELLEGAPCLFPSWKGAATGDGERELKPITDRALGYVVAKYAALAKVEDVIPHDLRYRFGYEMVKRAPLHRLAQVMGHDSLDTTMVYGGGAQGNLQKAVEQRAVEQRAWA